MNEDDNQLRVAHLILGYTPISRAFQASKCVIKAHNPHFHRICVAVEDFLLPEGASIPEGIPLVSPSSSRPMVEERDKKAKKKEEVVKLGSSKDEFEVFNQAQSSESPFGDLNDLNCTEADFLFSETPFEEDMGIQRKQKTSLLDLIESQPRKETQGRVAQSKPPSPSQSKLPPTSSKLPSPPLRPTLSPRTEPSDPKRKRESKGKEVIEIEKSHPTPEDEAQRAAKQQKVGHKGPKRKVNPLLKPQVWLPTPMLNGAPLMDNASIRDF